MILKKINVYPDQLEFSDDYYQFWLKTRSFCNYIERNIKIDKINCDGFNNLCVIGVTAPKDACIVNSSNSLSVEVAFDKDLYDKLDKQSYNEFYISMFKEGIRKCAFEHNLPLGRFDQIIKSFQNSNYVNNWVHKSKKPKGIGIRIDLNCQITLDEFIYSLKIYKQNKILLEKNIFCCEPDELLWAHRVHDVIVDDRIIKVINKDKRPVYSVDLDNVLDIK